VNVGLEDLFTQLGTDPRSGIAHLELNIAGNLASANRDAPHHCVAHELHCIGNEIGHDADEHARVARHGESRVRRLVVELNFLHLCLEPQVLDHACENVADARFAWLPPFPRDDVSTSALAKTKSPSMSFPTR
jgi:hypothetical protein